MTKEEWEARGVELFGEDRKQWRFVCPVCKHVASVQDWKDEGASEGAVAFSCVGRWLPAPRDAFQGKGPGPCNYAGGGLICLNPVQVEFEGATHHVFAFDET